MMSILDYVCIGIISCLSYHEFRFTLGNQLFPFITVCVKKER